MNNLSVFAFAIGLISAISGSASAQSKQLPTGNFTLFAGTDAAANFIVESSRVRSGDITQVTNYRIYAEEIPSPGGSIRQDTTELEINCALRTYRSLAVNAFQASGEWVVSFPAEAAKPIEPNQTWDFVARVVCDGVRFPADATVAGVEAARALGLSKIRPNP